MSTVRRHGAALLGYAAVFSAVLLPKILPARPGRLLATMPQDGSIFIWSLAWWAHALPHGNVLPYTHVLYAPGGTNLAWTTSVPLLGLLLTPVTNVFGPFASFNTVALLAPTTTAWTTYLLVERLTARWWAALAGGALFALSPFEVAQLRMGHLNLSVTALVPLTAYVVVRGLEGSLSARLFVLMLGLTVAAEVAVSGEIALTEILLGAVTLLLLFALDPERRSSIRRCARLGALGLVLGGMLASPIVATAVVQAHPTTRVPPLLSKATVVPWSSDLTLLAGLLAVGLVWRARREPAVRAALGTTGVALSCGVGSVAIGSSDLPTPYGLLAHVPLLGFLTPQRLTMYAWLVVATLVGVWLTEGGRAWRWIGVIAVLAAGFATVALGRWTAVIPPASAVEAIVPHDATVLAVAGRPPGPDQLHDLAFVTVWQAEAHFRFRLADGYVGSLPPPLPGQIRRLIYERALDPRAIRTTVPWVRRAGITDVVLVRATPKYAAVLQRAFGGRLQRWGSVVVLSLPRPRSAPVADRHQAVRIQ